jgi:hypothetical protein
MPRQPGKGSPVFAPSGYARQNGFRPEAVSPLPRP